MGSGEHVGPGQCPSSAAEGGWSNTQTELFLGFGLRFYRKGGFRQENERLQGLGFGVTGSPRKRWA